MVGRWDSHGGENAWPVGDVARRGGAAKPRSSGQDRRKRISGRPHNRALTHIENAQPEGVTRVWYLEERAVFVSPKMPVMLR